jgi:SAM-dependent methyltransferase
MTPVDSRDVAHEISAPNRAPARGSRCPLCDAIVDARANPEVVIRFARGGERWGECPLCRSFFALDEFDVERFTATIGATEYGDPSIAISFGEAKAPLFDAILRLLRSRATKGARLLDVGCSYGNFLRRARKEGYDVRGMDLFAGAVEYVRTLGLTCDRATSVDELAVTPQSIDIVTVLDCNYYWPDSRRELRAIHALLRPGGLLVMRVSSGSWAIRLGRVLARFVPSLGERLFRKAVYDHRFSAPILSLLRVISEERFSVSYTSVRDAVPVRQHNLQARVSYAVGAISWRLARINLAPGIVVIARKNP